MARMRNGIIFAALCAASFQGRAIAGSCKAMNVDNVLDSAPGEGFGPTEAKAKTAAQKKACANLQSRKRVRDIACNNHASAGCAGNSTSAIDCALVGSGKSVFTGCAAYHHLNAPMMVHRLPPKYRAVEQADGNAPCTYSCLATPKPVPPVVQPAPVPGPGGTATLPTNPLPPEPGTPQTPPNPSEGTPPPIGQPTPSPLK